MKILIDVRVLGHGGTSGIEEYTHELVGALLEFDQTNNYLLFANSFRKKHPLPEAWLRNPRVRVVNWHMPNKLLEVSVRFFGSPAIDRLLSADLVFSPHFTLLKTARAPRVITFHDLAFLHHPDFFHLRQKFWHWLQDYNGQAKKATHLIAVSEFTKYDLMVSLGIPEEKITVIYSGVSPLFRPLPEGNPRRAQFRESRELHFPFILSLGTLEPRKNIEMVIRAFTLLKRDTQFKNLRLLVAGRRGWLYQNIFREAKNSPVRDHIIFLGPVADEERVLLYNLASVFVYPSFFEGFGFPPLEAQACGTPVVVSDRTSLAEVIDDSGIRVHPWRIEELTEALRAILTKNDLRRTLIEKGLANARAFNWRLTAEQTLRTLISYASSKTRH